MKTAFLKRLRNPHDPWLNSAVFILHLTILIYLGLEFHSHRQEKLAGLTLFYADGETESYFEPIENLHEDGRYEWKTTSDRHGSTVIAPSTRRAPGFVPIYYPALLLFSPQAARDAVIIVQALFYLLGVFALARGAQMLFESKAVYYLTHLLTLLFWFEKPFVFLGLADSLALSFIVLSFYHFISYYRQQHKHYHLALMGLFGFWAVFMRPASAFWLVGLGLTLAFVPIQNKRAFLVRFSLVGMLPFAIPLVFWCTHVYQQTGYTWMPEDDASKSMPAVYPPSRMAIYSILKTWGTPTQYWIPGSEASYLLNGKEVELSDHYLFNRFDRSFFERVQSLYDYQKSGQATRKEIERIDQTLEDEAKAYRSAYRSKYPLRYYVLNRIKAISTFLDIGFYSYLPFPKLNDMNVLQMIIKASQGIMIYVLYFLAFLSLLFMRTFQTIRALPWTFIGVFLFVHGGVMLRIEPRYLLPVMPFMIVLSAFTLSRLPGTVRSFFPFNSRGSYSSKPAMGKTIQP